MLSSREEKITQSLSESKVGKKLHFAQKAKLTVKTTEKNYLREKRMDVEIHS